MVKWKIVWNSGGETASRYSSRKLAEKILKNSRNKGKIVKTNLSRYPRSPLSNKPCVWVRDPIKGGFSYRTRCVEALQKNEKKRVVRW